MKPITLFFLCFTILGFSQNVILKFKSNQDFETKIMDSIGYKKEVLSEKEANQEADFMLKKIIKLGYFEAQYQKTATAFIFNFGTKINFININIPVEEQKYFNFKAISNNQIKIKPSEFEDFMNQSILNYDKNGFGFVSLQLIEISKIKNEFFANLQITYPNKRTVNQLVINGYGKFPKGHLKRLKRRYLNQIFSQELVKNIDKSTNNINFIKQIRYPEILFKKDSTQIYLYLEKQNNNQFDGFLGFVINENQNLIFTGYLDLKLQNIVNSGETLKINWRNDGNNQSSFAINLKLPLLFNTSFGLETSLQVFKQDSLFQNSKTDVKINYLLPNDSNIAIGLNQNSSNSISKIAPVNLIDFENTFYTLNYNFFENNFEDVLFPEKFALNFSTGFGSRKTKLINEQQYFIKINGFYHIHLNKKNSIWINNSNFILNSNSYLINELERFGGIYSIRGFQENSLQANILTMVSTEYRYKLSSNLYVHSISDFAYFEDATSQITKQIIGLGFGMGLNTKNGLFKLNYATGFEKNNAPSFQNALLHFSFVTKF